jgi:hypothetical protein
VSECEDVVQKSGRKDKIGHGWSFSCMDTMNIHAERGKNSHCHICGRVCVRGRVELAGGKTLELTENEWEVE